MTCPAPDQGIIVGRKAGGKSGQDAAGAPWARRMGRQSYTRRKTYFRRTARDKYGRTLGDVFLLDGTNVNHTLVKDGWCWWYRK